MLTKQDCIINLKYGQSLIDMKRHECLRIHTWLLAFINRKKWSRHVIVITRLIHKPNAFVLIVPDCNILLMTHLVENSSLPSSLDFLKTKQKHIFSLSLSSFSSSPCPASFCSEQCLKCCITSTSCDRLPLYNVSIIVFLYCKSVWIKASAKWINVVGSKTLST